MNNDLKVKATLVEKTSKAGNLYKVLELEFANGFKKTLFLEDAEMFIIESLTK